MNTVNLAAPWYTFQKKVAALFEGDPQIVVGEIYRPDNGAVDFAFDIEVKNHKKFLALDRVLPKTKDFGGLTLGIALFDEENVNENTDTRIGLFATIFEGNPILKDVQTAQDHTGTAIGFVRFQPEVVQFYNDDLSDYSRNWSGLAQDIAREVFTNDFQGVYFCTAAKNED